MERSIITILLTVSYLVTELGLPLYILIEKNHIFLRTNIDYTGFGAGTIEFGSLSILTTAIAGLIYLKGTEFGRE